MSKRVILGAVVAGFVLLGVIGGGDQPASSNLDTIQSDIISPTVEVAAEPIKPTCDGSAIAANCVVDGIAYATYIYHPAVPEKTRTETITTYRQEVASYCTLCNDGTFSPSCATGRGACSHHGGVAQWNAPRYRSVPVHDTRTVVDAPAQEPYYEKILE